jgi:hypothetical protein
MPLVNKIHVTTGWKGSGSLADPFRPAFADDYPGHLGWTDKTGGAPNVGTYTLEVLLDNPTLTAVMADLKYSASVVNLGTVSLTP